MQSCCSLCILRSCGGASLRRGRRAGRLVDARLLDVLTREVTARRRCRNSSCAGDFMVNSRTNEKSMSFEAPNLAKTRYCSPVLGIPARVGAATACADWSCPGPAPGPARRGWGEGAARPRGPILGVLPVHGPGTQDVIVGPRWAAPKGKCWKVCSLEIWCRGCEHQLLSGGFWAAGWLLLFTSRDKGGLRLRKVGVRIRLSFWENT